MVFERYFFNKKSIAVAVTAIIASMAFYILNLHEFFFSIQAFSLEMTIRLVLHIYYLITIGI